MSDQEPSQAPLRSLFASDARRGAVTAAFGCVLLAVLEYVATLWTYPSDEGVGLTVALRLVVLVVTLSGILWLVAAPLMAAACVLSRAALLGISRQRASQWPGLLSLSKPREGAAAGPAWALAILVGAGAFIAGSALLTLDFGTRFKEPVLRAILLALLQLGIMAIAVALSFALALGFRLAGRAVHPWLREANPLGRWMPAFGLLVLLSVPAINVVLELVPTARGLVPWRHLLALMAFIAGSYAGAHLLRVRGGLFPSERRPRRIAVGIAVLGSLLVASFGLLSAGAHPQTKYLVITASPTLSRTVELVRFLNDFDGDGYGSLLGENDCGPFDAALHPGARDVPDNGIDENCSGKDFSLASLPTYRKGERMEVPEEFRRDWNILLITVDTVRYDHTTMAGYERDTTPELAKLARRSANFTFANAPSAGTMASIPAILTSKFFHSGIALIEKVKRGMPPRLKPSNTLISELLKTRGYRTGAILTHEYFNDWGMEQGFDTYDNELGKRRNPKGITSERLTDRAIAWIASNSNRKWFLWTHYLDPHGHYMEHKGEKNYGSSEKDRYHGELHFTDKHLGRLFREIERMPNAHNTIIIITSDHGDAFGEHGFINHGQALYKELLHVPLIIYVPDLPPRKIGGAVTPLDIVPTVADLAGVDTSRNSFEGESLVPQLFYRKDAPERVVFAETNWPKPLRAAITQDHKLVFKLKSNVYEFFDLKADPLEKRNISGRGSDKEAALRAYLDDWLERVYFSRDLETNQAAGKLTDTVLRKRPSPQHVIDGPTFDEGRIKLIGYDIDKKQYRPGQRIKLALYFEVLEQPTADYRLQVEGWLDVPEPPQQVGRSQLRFTRKGLFASSHWRKGEFIRDRFGITVPRGWGAGPIAIGLRMKSRAGVLDTPTGTPRSPEHPNLARFATTGHVPALNAPKPKLAPRSKGSLLPLKP